MKRIVALFLIFFFSFNMSSAFALSNNVTSSLTYLAYRNEYRLDYWNYPGSAVSLFVSFTSPTGQIFTTSYDSSALTGIFYLTCTGTYYLHLNDTTGGTVASITDIATPDVTNGTCSSYASGTAKNDLGLTTTKNADGSFTMNWNTPPGATNYDVYKDGTLIKNTTGTTTNVTGDGSYNVRAKNPSGTILGESDIAIRNGTSTAGNSPSPPGSGTCNGCDWIKSALSCPEWNTYMGEFTKAIQAALPPPPDWVDIADKIGTATVQHLQDYYGPVPTAPTQQEIDSSLNTTLPAVDNSAADAAKLVPSVPAGYEQPKAFDIQSGPQIDVTDNSQPFQILNPLHNIQYDAPGVQVIPGDTRNNTGGIEQPQAVTLPTPTPTPTNNLPPMPDVPVPIPGSSPGPGPIPGGTGGPGPVPVWKGG